MAPPQASGTEGYTEDIEALARKFDGISFAGLHGPVLHLIPKAPCQVLDIGSGSGRDAAALAAMGHSVVAIEPVAGLRQWAAARHRSPLIEWLDDSLPELKSLGQRREVFDVVMLTAVWMHLDEAQRRQAMLQVAPLVRKGGVAIFTLRHGPIPPGRRMFAVSADETTALAAASGLNLLLKLEDQPGYSGRPDTRWTTLAFTNEKCAGTGAETPVPG